MADGKYVGLIRVIDWLESSSSLYENKETNQTAVVKFLSSNNRGKTRIFLGSSRKLANCWQDESAH